MKILSNSSSYFTDGRKRRMPRERAHPLPPPLRTSLDEVQTGDQVLVRNAVLGNEHLAVVIEIKEVAEDDASTSPPATADTAGQKVSTDEPAAGEKATTNAAAADGDANEEKHLVDQQQPSISGVPSTSSTPTAGPSNADKKEEEKEAPPVKRRRRQRQLYYVHYVGIDRRLDEWVDEQRIVQAPPDANGTILLPPMTPNATTTLITRSQRRLNEDFYHVPKSIDDLDATTRKLELEHEERTKVKNVDRIQFGEWEIDAWYFSPFPLSITINKSKIYFCEFCLWYTADQADYTCHRLHQCRDKHCPPGEPIYEDGQLVVYAVKGRESKAYCQCLCLLSKLFLDHKTLYYDVEGFLFYVLCELDEYGVAHPVGHFSKELNSVNNLACIMVLPPYQRNGYGKLLIQISYCLSEREGVVGTPEKPLSDLGKVSYRSYWWWVLIGVLDREQVDASISVAELSRLSGIHVEDIVETFKTLGVIKYWRGDHVVRISKKVVSQIKQLHLFHPPKLILRKSAVRWRRASTVATVASGDGGGRHNHRQMVEE